MNGIVFRYDTAAIRGTKTIIHSVLLFVLLMGPPLALRGVHNAWATFYAKIRKKARKCAIFMKKRLKKINPPSFCAGNQRVVVLFRVECVEKITPPLDKGVFGVVYLSRQRSLIHNYNSGM